jgi:hypothetical protein
MTADDVIRTHTQRFNGALLSRDLEALSSIYADDYMLVRPDGSSLSKHEVLHDLRDGGFMFKSVELDDRWNVYAARMSQLRKSSRTPSHTKSPVFSTTTSNTG